MRAWAEMLWSMSGVILRLTAIHSSLLVNSARTHFYDYFGVNWKPVPVTLRMGRIKDGKRVWNKWWCQRHVLFVWDRLPRSLRLRNYGNKKFTLNVKQLSQSIQKSLYLIGYCQGKSWWILSLIAIISFAKKPIKSLLLRAKGIDGSIEQ